MFKEVTFHNPATYLLAVKAQRRMTLITKTVFLSLILLAVCGLGYSISQSGILKKDPQQTELQAALDAEENVEAEGKIGVVFLAFDPSELDGVEDLTSYFEEYNADQEEWVMENDSDKFQFESSKEIEDTKNLTVSNF